MASIALENLAVTFKTRRGLLSVLENISLSVSEGEFVCILGSSGCGKSTLLNVVAGLLEPDGGRVVINGRPAAGRERAERIGFVFQRPTLIPWKTTAQNIQFSLATLRYGNPDSWPDRIRQQIEMVGLGGFEDAFPRELSGGMQSRVGLARALVIEPALLLMDEPFSSLDQLTAGRLRTELLQLWGRKRITTLFVTHDIAEAVYLADRIILLSPRPGRIYREYPVKVPRPRALGHERLVQIQTQILQDLNSIPGAASPEPIRAGPAVG